MVQLKGKNQAKLEIKKIWTRHDAIEIMIKFIIMSGNIRILQFISTACNMILQAVFNGMLTKKQVLAQTCHSQLATANLARTFHGPLVNKERGNESAIDS